MKRKIGVAALLGLLTTFSLATSAMAQCGTGPMIVLNTNTFAYETVAPGAPYLSASGSTLTVVGLAQLFCTPFLDLNPASADTEYTVVFSGLVSGGTTTNHVGSTFIYTTHYSGGQFGFYQDHPKNAPTSAAAMPANPPNAVVPANYQDGTLILSGTFSGFTVQVTQTGTNPANGSWLTNFQFTGGSLFSRVSTLGTALAQGNFCVTGCLPPAGGYSAQLDGKFDSPTTPAHSSTWGAIKQLYR
jgi:hypothetical protein